MGSTWPAAASSSTWRSPPTAAGSRSGFGTAPPDREKARVDAKLVKPFNHPDPELGLRNTKHLAGLLDKAHPGAANSLREGLEEVFTVRRLGTDRCLAKTLVTSNPVVMSIARTTNRNVTRWRDGHMVQRWTAARMLNAEQIPPLSKALHRHAHPPTASQTETVGAAALSSDQIAIQVPRDSGNPRSHTEPLVVAVVPQPHRPVRI